MSLGGLGHAQHTAPQHVITLLTSRLPSVIYMMGLVRGRDQRVGSATFEYVGGWYPVKVQYRETRLVLQ